MNTTEFELAKALRDLLELVETFNDVELTRDIEPYKAQAIYDRTLERAREVLEKVRP